MCIRDRDTDSKDELMKALAAGGFKDITRIASSSPVMWQQICLKNGKNISRILGDYIDMLSRTKELVECSDDEVLYTLSVSYTHLDVYKRQAMCS